MPIPFIIIFLINMMLYLVVNNLKMRRYAAESLKKEINAIFGMLIGILAVIVALFILRKSAVILLIDGISLLLLGILLCRIILINYDSLKKVISTTFRIKSNMIEIILLTLLLLLGFVEDFLWMVLLITLFISLLREVFIMDEVRKKYE